jgi:hypothetical protein
MLDVVSGMAQWPLSDRINFWAAVGQVGAATFTFFALLLTVWTFRRQLTMQRWQLRVARESHILKWAEDCIDAMAEVETIIQTNLGRSCDDLMQHRLIAIRTRLSALIDHGRLFFPNVPDLDKGRDKDGAYQGSRQPILDHLVAYYDETGKALATPDRPFAATDRAGLNAHRRRFITEAQQAIDPNGFNRISAQG